MLPILLFFYEFKNCRKNDTNCFEFSRLTYKFIILQFSGKYMNNLHAICVEFKEMNKIKIKLLQI